MNTLFFNKKNGFVLLLLFAYFFNDAQNLSIRTLKKSIKINKNKSYKSSKYNSWYLNGSLKDVFTKDTLVFYDNVQLVTISKLYGVNHNHHVFEFKRFKKVFIHWDHDFFPEHKGDIERLAFKKYCDEYKYKIRKKKGKIVMFVKNKCGFAYAFELIMTKVVLPKQEIDYHPNISMYPCYILYFTKYLNTKEFYQIKNIGIQ